MLDAFVQDGTVTLVALGALALEFAVLLWVAVARRRAPAISTLAMLLSGLFLILALRAALIDQGSGPIALFLALGGITHLAEIATRPRRSE